MKKQKAEPKPVNLDFDIPDYRRDKRYIQAQGKLNDLQAKARELRLTIDRIKAEKPEVGVNFQARRLLMGEPPSISPDNRLTELYNEERIVKKAAELQTDELEQLKITICREYSRDPVLVAHVAEVFRTTGRVMEQLYAAMIAEDALVSRLAAVGLGTSSWGGLSFGRAEWHIHTIFQDLRRAGLNSHSNPVYEYLQWNRKHFEADTK